MLEREASVGADHNLFQDIFRERKPLQKRQKSMISHWLIVILQHKGCRMKYEL